MAKRNKNKRQVARSSMSEHAAKRSVSPTLYISARIMSEKGNLQQDNETKSCEIHFPVTLSQLAYEIAHIAFALAEELAFKAKVEFLPDKELKIEK